MILHRQDSSWEIRAPAKVNLCLDVLGRREDGYHEVETLMVPLGLHDTITVVTGVPSAEQSDPIHLQIITPFTDSVSWSPLTEGQSNLVYRAVDALRQAAGISAGARIQLRKRIPLEAGLGGGSSDAAAALVASNAAWNLGWNRTRLSRIAASIGSDIPFFLEGGTAVCRGRGEQVTRVRHATPLHVVIARPPVGLSTADVFRSFDMTESHGPGPTTHIGNSDGARGRVSDAVTALLSGRLADLGRLLFNGLEPAARRLTDWIDRLVHAFQELNVLGHAMTGSGTAYYGLCHNAAHAQRTAAMLRGQGMGWICTSQAVL